MKATSPLRLTAIFVLTLSLLSLTGVPGIRYHGIPSVRADPAPTNGVSPLTTWVPAGPQMDKLLITIYPDEGTEYSTGLLGNQLDLTDWPAPASQRPTINGDSRMYLTAANSEFGMFDIDFNNANNFFGIAGNYGADGTSSTAAFISFKQGVAHLIDKVNFIALILGGKAQPIDNSLPPGQGVRHSGLELGTTNPGNGANPTGPYSVSYTAANGATGSYNLQGVCNWDIASGQTQFGVTHDSTCVSAFRNGNDPAGDDSVGIVKADPTNHDYCDAAVHWALAGLANGISADCSLSTHFTGTGSITFVVRGDSAPGLALGDALAARMCQLINGNTFSGTCTQINVVHETITQATKDVFPSCATNACSSPNLFWNIYTAGWGLTANPDQAQALYNSNFAGVSTGTPCNGNGDTHGQDYVHFCNTRQDHYTQMLEFNDSATVGAGQVPAYIASLQVSMDLMGNHTVTIPIWSGANQFGYLKGWTGVNDAKGFGPPNFFTLLNMWNPNPVVPGTIRWGFKQGTATLNPYNFATVWENYIITNTFDGLLAANHDSPTDLFGWMVNGWTFLTPGTTQCPATQADAIKGTITPVQQCIKFALRNDISFHDGVKLTAGDVKYSFISYKKAGGSIAPLVVAVLDVTYLDDNDFIVVMSQKGPFQLNNVGGVPILPSHIWSGDTTLTGGQQLLADKCTVTNQANGACTLNTALLSGPDADPVATHRLVGSGAWECIDITTGQVGGGCTSTGTDATSNGNTIVLTRFGFGQNPLDANKAYFRSSAKYAQWQWADITPGPSPTFPSRESVDIFDAEAAGACNSQRATTTLCARADVPGALATSITSGVPATPPTLPATIPFGGKSVGIIDITVVSQIFRWFGVKWTTPLLYSQLTGGQTLPQTLYQTGSGYVRAPDVAISANAISVASPIPPVFATSASLAAGGTASWVNQLTSTATAGPAFSGTATVTATSSNAPAGTTISPSPGSMALAAGGTGTSTVTATVPAGTPVGTVFNVIECVSFPATYTYYTVTYIGSPVTSITVTTVTVTITVTQCINVKVTVTA